MELDWRHCAGTDWPGARLRRRRRGVGGLIDMAGNLKDGVEDLVDDIQDLNLPKRVWAVIDRVGGAAEEAYLEEVRKARALEWSARRPAGIHPLRVVRKGLSERRRGQSVGVPFVWRAARRQAGPSATYCYGRAHCLGCRRPRRTAEACPHCADPLLRAA